MSFRLQYSTPTSWKRISRSLAWTSRENNRGLARHLIGAPSLPVNDRHALLTENFCIFDQLLGFFFSNLFGELAVSQEPVRHFVELPATGYNVSAVVWIIQNECIPAEGFARLQNPRSLARCMEIAANRFVYLLLYSGAICPGQNSCGTELSLGAGVFPFVDRDGVLTHKGRESRLWQIRKYFRRDVLRVNCVFC